MIDLLDFLGVMLGLEAMGVLSLIVLLVIALVALVKGSLLIAAVALAISVWLLIYGAGMRRKAGRNEGDA